MGLEESIPMIVESTPRGDRMYDIITRLLRDRIIFLRGEIEESSAILIVSQLLYLNSQGKQDIRMYIMSPGGEVSSALAIYDTMQALSCDVATYCIGEACSAAAVLLASGSPGKRFSLPSARIMIHQPWGGAIGDNTSVQIQAKEMDRVKQMLYERLALHTGRTTKQIERDCDRDHFMSPGEAKEYGLIDKVVCPKTRKR
jgi:ATP-dependent Clp protease protease subunit